MLESSGVSVKGSFAVFPDVDGPFKAAGVTVDGTDSVGPVVATAGLVFVVGFPVICLFVALDGGGWPKEVRSCRRRFSECGS